MVKRQRILSKENHEQLQKQVHKEERTQNANKATERS